MKTKLKLENFEVQSFVTSLSEEIKNNLKGGSISSVNNDCHNSDACFSAIRSCQLPVCV